MKKISIRIDSPGTCLAVWLSCLSNQKRGEGETSYSLVGGTIEKNMCTMFFFLIENSHAKLNKNHVELGRVFLGG